MESNQLIDILHRASGNTAVIILSVSIAICVIRWNQLSTPFRRLFFFLLWNLAIEIAARVFANYKINNLPLLHLYTLGEFILISYFYKSIISKPLALIRSFNVLIIGGVALIVANSIFLQSIYEFNSLAKSFVQLWIISLAVIYFYHLSSSQSFSNITKKAMRLVNSAFLIYYSGSLFVFMCSQLYLDKAGLYKSFWIFNAILNVIFQLLILWAISKVVFRKTPSSS